VRNQAQKIHSSTRSVAVGVKAAWRAFLRSQKPATQRRSSERLPPARPSLDLGSDGLERRLNDRHPLPEELPTPQQSFISTQEGLEHIADSPNGTISNPETTQNHPAPQNHNSREAINPIHPAAEIVDRR
ncbi:MAG: hypothetical protein WCA35_07225, partial [Kovacikia sp.]